MNMSFFLLSLFLFFSFSKMIKALQVLRIHLLELEKVCIHPIEHISHWQCIYILCNFTVCFPLFLSLFVSQTSSFEWKIKRFKNYAVISALDTLRAWEEKCSRKTYCDRTIHLNTTITCRIQIAPSTLLIT